MVNAITYSLSSTLSQGGQKPPLPLLNRLQRLCPPHDFPWFGLPTSLQSDHGPAFTSQIAQQISQALNTPYELHTAWQPQCSGKAKQTHSTLKQQLTRPSLELSQSWIELLPHALLRLPVPARAPLCQPLGAHTERSHLLPIRLAPGLASGLPTPEPTGQLPRPYADTHLPQPTELPCNQHLPLGLVSTQGPPLSSQTTPASWGGPLPSRSV